MSDKHDKIREINKRLKKLGGVSFEQQLSEANDKIKELENRVHELSGIEVYLKQKETIERLCDALEDTLDAITIGEPIFDEYRALVKEVKE